MNNKQTIKQILKEGTEDTITRIAVFDFDGTLSDTPMPDTGRIEYEKITGSPWPHKGWWGRPETLDMDVIYSRDDEGNGFQQVHYAPSKGNYEDMEFQEGDEDVNAVCIN
jgi:hypothetical protein